MRGHLELGLLIEPPINKPRRNSYETPGFVLLGTRKMAKNLGKSNASRGNEGYQVALSGRTSSVEA